MRFDSPRKLPALPNRAKVTQRSPVRQVDDNFRKNQGKAVCSQ